ncbi:SGNH/GDSL hydrolase family protein [Actinophytocola xanthii]|uniref:Lysophospholipase n=1 Tax=Actinophytocola xanthii TaxID=1912961 RepID=A0A1Q8CWS4_9PSEU|nr:SGNH/GDSL hydrolase family protein [Actinophytocola xanthii]OLF18800.1 lysophospholipase [Actinophytocola xanthii]
MYSRYVALGDSQTEGLMDGDELRGYRGWADRLAGHLAAVNPGLHYANLAVRGHRAHQVHHGQLGPALDLRPDLATVVAGVNDLLRRRFDGAAVAAHLEAMFAALTGAGARVLTVVFPDPALLMPAARPLSARTAELNARIRAAAARHGVTVVNLTEHPVCTDPRLWSPDRLHLSPLGHARFAAGAAHALGLPGFHTWSDPLGPRPPVGAWQRAGAELRWVRGFAGPWLARRLRGRSSGDGRVAKRPALAPPDSPAD